MGEKAPLSGSTSHWYTMEYLNDILLAEVNQQIEIMHELRQLEIRLALGLHSGLEKTRV